MIRIDQTEADNINKSDCVNVAIASLTEIPYDEIPKFNLFGDEWFDALKLFLHSKGYFYKTGFYNFTYYKDKYHLCNIDKSYFIFDEKTLLEQKGVNGYFYAVTNGYQEGKLHAVVIDKNFNIINTGNDHHYDKNNMPEKDKYGFNGIIYVYIIEKL